MKFGKPISNAFVIVLPETIGFGDCNYVIFFFLSQINLNEKKPKKKFEHAQQRMEEIIFLHKCDSKVIIEVYIPESINAKTAGTLRRDACTIVNDCAEVGPKPEKKAKEKNLCTISV